MYPDYKFDYPNMDTSFPFFMKLKRYHCVPLHRHDFLEFSLVVEGEGTETINGTTHNMSPGTLTLLQPYQVHEFRARPGQSLLMYVLNFDLKLLDHSDMEEKLSSILLNMTEDAAPSYVELTPQQMQDFIALFEKMKKEYDHDFPWKNIVLRSQLMEALCYFDRVRRSKYPYDMQDMNAGNKKTIWQVIHYLHRNYLEPVTLTEVAGKFDYHPSYLSELMKKHLGQNFIHFIQELRIRHACSLLLSTDMPIPEIAEESGFNSVPTFTRVFRRHKKMSPSQFRKSRKGK